MPPKRQRSPVRDIWDADGGTRAIDRPVPIETSPGWTLDPESVPLASRNMARRRVVAAIKPNKRAAVPIPHEAQSFNPLDDVHQAALKKVVEKLHRKKVEHERFVAKLHDKGTSKYCGTLLQDKTWDNDDDDAAAPATGSARGATSSGHSSSAAAGKRDTNADGGVTTTAASVDDASKKKKKDDKKAKKKKAKKETVVVTATKTRRQRTHRRHPERATTLDQTAELDEIVKAQKIADAKTEKRMAERLARRKSGQQVKVFGRHHYTPLVMDVARTGELVGSLRHLAASKNVHLALDRMKSLEERNLVPARMRHKYNKKKDFKPHGEVRPRREEIGIMPE